MENRNKRLDAALREAKKTLAQKKKALLETKKREAELTARKLKIDHECETLSHLYKDEKRANVQVLSNTLEKSCKNLALLKVKQNKATVLLEHAKGKKDKATLKLEEAFQNHVKFHKTGPVGGEITTLKIEIGKLKNSSMEDLNKSMKKDLNELQDKLDLLKKESNSIENESIKKQHQKDLLQVESDRLQKATKIDENRIKATKIRLEKLKEEDN